MDDPTEAPLFSIILPTLNAESVIAACLDSIAGQTLRDYEVLVLDGLSRDHTAAVIGRCQASLGGRLTLCSERDQGIYDAMNRGVARARGQWLYFLGADDRLHHPQILEQVAAFLRANPDCRLAYGDVILRSTSSRYGGAFDLDELLFRRNICHQAIFYRRDVFAGIGPYNLRYRIWADWDLNLRCFGNPALVARYMDIVVADYDDTGGLSLKEDEELRKRLPVFILRGKRPRWMGALAAALRQIAPRRGRFGR